MSGLSYEMRDDNQAMIPHILKPKVLFFYAGSHSGVSGGVRSGPGADGTGRPARPSPPAAQDNANEGAEVSQAYHFDRPKESLEDRLEAQDHP